MLASTFLPQFHYLYFIRLTLKCPCEYTPTKNSSTSPSLNLCIKGPNLSFHAFSSQALAESIQKAVVQLGCYCISQGDLCRSFWSSLAIQKYTIKKGRRGKKGLCVCGKSGVSRCDIYKMWLPLLLLLLYSSALRSLLPAGAILVI